jgi:transcriptional regulator with XRE-family HTH domain
VSPRNPNVVSAPSSPLRAARRNAGLSIVRAANAAGLDPRYWQRIELGKRQPSLDVLRRMAQAVGLTDFALLLEPYVVDRDNA